VEGGSSAQSIVLRPVEQSMTSRLLPRTPVDYWGQVNTLAFTCDGANIRKTSIGQSKPERFAHLVQRSIATLRTPPMPSRSSR